MKNPNIIIIDTGLNNKVNIHPSILLQNNSILKITIKGNYNQIKILQGCNFKNTEIFVDGSNNFICLNRYVKFQGNITIKFNQNSVDIGKFCSFDLVNMNCSEGSKISIGEKCMFSRNINIRTNDQHSIIDNDTKEKLNFSKDIYIGNYVWCGMNANILKGAYISSISVIGAFSIVTKKFSQNCVFIAGKPAKIVKENILWLKQSVDKNTIINQTQIDSIKSLNNEY